MFVYAICVCERLVAWMNFWNIRHASESVPFNECRLWCETEWLTTTSVPSNHSTVYMITCIHLAHCSIELKELFEVTLIGRPSEFKSMRNNISSGGGERGSNPILKNWTWCRGTSVVVFVAVVATADVDICSFNSSEWHRDSMSKSMDHGYSMWVNTLIDVPISTKIHPLCKESFQQIRTLQMCFFLLHLCYMAGVRTEYVEQQFIVALIGVIIVTISFHLTNL